MRGEPLSEFLEPGEGCVLSGRCGIPLGLLAPNEQRRCGSTGPDVQVFRGAVRVRILGLSPENLGWRVGRLGGARFALC